MSVASTPEFPIKPRQKSLSTFIWSVLTGEDDPFGENSNISDNLETQIINGGTVISGTEFKDVSIDDINEKSDIEKSDSMKEMKLEENSVEDKKDDITDKSYKLTVSTESKNSDKSLNINMKINDNTNYTGLNSPFEEYDRFNYDTYRIEHQSSTNSDIPSVEVIKSEKRVSNHSINSKSSRNSLNSKENVIGKESEYRNRRAIVSLQGDVNPIERIIFGDTGTPGSMTEGDDEIPYIDELPEGSRMKLWEAFRNRTTSNLSYASNTEDENEEDDDSVVARLEREEIKSRTSSATRDGTNSSSHRQSKKNSASQQASRRTRSEETVSRSRDMEEPRGRDSETEKDLKGPVVQGVYKENLLKKSESSEKLEGGEPQILVEKHKHTADEEIGVNLGDEKNIEPTKNDTSLLNINTYLNKNRIELKDTMFNKNNNSNNPDDDNHNGDDQTRLTAQGVNYGRRKSENINEISSPQSSTSSSFSTKIGNFMKVNVFSRNRNISNDSANSNDDDKLDYNVNNQAIASPNKPKHHHDQKHDLNHNHDQQPVKPFVSIFDYLPVPKLRLEGRLSDSHPVLSFKAAEVLRNFLPNILKDCTPWKLAYGLDQHGSSLSTLYRQCADCGPVLLAVEDDMGAVWGAFANEGLHIESGFYGTSSCFLFKINPPNLPPPPSAIPDNEDESNDETSNQYEPIPEVFTSTLLNNYYILCEKHMIAFGSGWGRFGLWINADFTSGTWDVCETFSVLQDTTSPYTSSYEELTSMSPQSSSGPRTIKQPKDNENTVHTFNIMGMEVWCFE